MMPFLHAIKLLFISGIFIISFIVPNVSALVVTPLTHNHLAAARHGKIPFGAKVSQTHTQIIPRLNVGSDTALHANFGRSGNKRERLEKLAALEEEKIETDKGFVVKAAGGFVGLMVVLLIAGLAGGVFDELLLKAM